MIKVQLTRTDGAGYILNVIVSKKVGLNRPLINHKAAIHQT